MNIKNRLPALLVPQSDEAEAERQLAQLTDLADQLGLFIRDLKTQENLLRLQSRNRFSDSWAMKQKMADVQMDKDESESLARLIADVLRGKGLNPMEVAFRLHELIENSELQLEDAQQAIQEGTPRHSSIGPPARPTAAHMAPLHMLDTAVPSLTFAYLLLRWGATKLKAARDKKNRRAS
jgi:hypothetical protein